MLLRLENICKDYLQGSMKVPALKNIQLHIRAGEYVAIMGPSGSGKSTLMNIIGLLDKPTSGQYEFEGRAIMDRSEREMTKLRLSSLGFVFQNFQLMGKQSALSNVEMPLIYAGIRKKERIERAEEALRLVGLEDRARFKPVQLSGGQKQRVAIARAMVNHPKVLLADEPTGALDSRSGAQIMDLFEELNAAGTTVIMITHDPKVAERAKRVVDIFDGELFERGHQD